MTWYRDTYLRSTHWTAFRRAQLRRRLICEECLRAPATELHHRHYYDSRSRSVLGRESASDVTAICRKCHDDIEDFKSRMRESKGLPRGVAGGLAKTVRDWLS